jgi:SAM-dependent methyltransferase
MALPAPKTDILAEHSYHVEGFAPALKFCPELVQQNVDELIQLYWQNHPRFCFVKMTPTRCRLFDVGANAGGLSYWKAYGKPLRQDIRLYGVDLARAEFADRYEEFFVLNLDSDRIPVSESFVDAVLMSHVIEHLRKPQETLDELCRVLAPGGRLYLEWPAPWTEALPSKTAFIAAGLKVSTLRFEDDLTHIEAFEAKKLLSMVEVAGFTPITSGVVSMPFLEDQLFSTGVVCDSEELITYGIWLKTRWAQFIIAEKAA